MNVRVLVILLLWPIAGMSADELTNPTGWMTSSELNVIRIRMDEHRMLPIQVDGRLEGSEILYRATFGPFPQDTNYYYTYWGMTDAWYAHNNNELTEQGYQQLFHSTFYDLSGTALHQATWVLIDDLPKSYWERAAVEAELYLERVLEILR